MPTWIRHQINTQETMKMAKKLLAPQIEWTQRDLWCIGSHSGFGDLSIQKWNEQCYNGEDLLCRR
jgi:7-cyano-7-deazaguanine synthase in queuosine biosynthesis